MITKTLLIAFDEKTHTQLRKSVTKNRITNTQFIVAAVREKLINDKCEEREDK